MKKTFFFLLIVTAPVFWSAYISIQTAEVCDRKALSASCKKKLLPYKYDSQQTTKILFKKKPQLLEVEAQVFIGEKYRIVFNRSALPKNIKISVYTKDKESRKREAIFTSDEVKPDEKEFTFEPPRVRKLFVDYDVPADSLDQKLSGCVAFAIGYK